MVCSEENGIFSTSTQIPESVYVPGHTIPSMSKVHIKAIELHFRILTFLYLLEKIAILRNLMSLSFIGNMYGRLFFITQY